jgi:hypothetical protein
MDATDLKLLELAGIAAGETYSEERNPLDCDSLALRLAVNLGLHITPYPVYEEQKHSVVVLRNQDFVQQMRTPHNPTEVVEPYNADPYAATRRAIVRAAAEIGRAMK